MTAFIPLKHVLPRWPEEVIPEPEAFKAIGISDVNVAFASPSRLRATGKVQLLEEIILEPPFARGLSIAFLANDDITEFGFEILRDRANFSLGLTNLSAALRIDSNLLRRVEEVDQADARFTTDNGKLPDGWIEATDETGERLPVEIGLGGAALRVNQSGRFDFSFADGITLEITPFTIGNTGIVVDVNSLKLVLNLEAAIALYEYIDTDWRGVFIEHAAVHFPPGLSEALPPDLLFDEMFIGSGGFCGRITGDWSTLPEDRTLCGLPFAIRTAAIEFRQNTITEFALEGALTLPFFDTPIDVVVGYTNDGHFTVLLTGESGGATATTDLFTLNLTHLGIEAHDGEFVVTFGGSLDLADVGGVDLPTISVDDLRVTSDGRVVATGFAIALDAPQVLDFHGFQVTLTDVRFETEDSRNVIRCAASVNLTGQTPVGVAAKGLGISWMRGLPIDAMLDSARLSLEGIGVNFDIKDVLSFDGAVSYFEREGMNGDILHQFDGGVELRIIAMDLIVSARLIIGQTGDPGSRFAYLYIDARTDLPTGIPIAATGAAIYGLNGLFALNMEPRHDATPDFDWYGQWYFVGQPWDPARGAVGLGVGMTLGTHADNGHTFNTKVAFVIVFPGPILMLQGTGNIMTPRSDLKDNPAENTFGSLIVFDGTNGTLLAALSAMYQMPEDPPGLILDAAGSAEAFFDFGDASNWHVYLGEQEESKRIRARALSVFDADAYLMVDSQSLRVGTSIGINARYDIEVAEVALTALIAGDAEVTWAPQHLAGRLQFDGELAFRALRCELGLAVSAAVEVATPNDFEVRADLAISVDLPWPIGEFQADMSLEWQEAHAAQPIEPVLASAHMRAYKTSDTWRMQLRPAGETSDGHDDAWFVDDENKTFRVPMDARPLLSFNRAVHDDAGCGSPSPAASTEDAGNDRFTYRLTEVALHHWTGDAWEPVPDVTGAWQATGEPAGTALELFGDGPFSYARDSLTGQSTSASPAGPWPIPFIDSFLALADGFPFRTSARTVDFRAFDIGQSLGPRFRHEAIRFVGWNAATSPPSPQDIVIVEGSMHGIRLGPEHVQKSRLDPVGTVQELDLVFPAAANVDALSLFVAPDRAGVTLSVTGRKVGGDDVVETYSLADGARPLVLGEKFRGVRRLRLSSAGCHLEGLEWWRSSESADAQSQLAQATAMSIEPRPLLLPARDYRLTVTTLIDAEASESRAATSYAFFRTDGPPSDLTLYVDRVVCANSGRAHYGAYDLRIVFNENYVDALYGDDLQLVIRDENGARVQADVELEWRHVGGEIEPEYYRSAWLSSVVVASQSQTLDSVLTGDATPVELRASFTPSTRLPRSSELTAELRYNDTVIWSHGFRTSAYANVKALVSHFRPTAWSEVCSDADWVLSPDATFDDAWYGSLARAPKPTPSRPAVTALRDSDNRTRMLLVELPEPMEWPRVTLGLILSDAPLIEQQRIESNDGTRALLLRDEGWPDGEYSMEWTFHREHGELQTLSLKADDEDLEFAQVSVFIG